ncbi:MAG: hypothetical protein JST21_16360 [Bacteroidetes bacterium]|nr:hypothetical protein [Bacteroidota bacterium]
MNKIACIVMTVLISGMGFHAFTQEKSEMPCDHSVLKLEAPKGIFLGNNRQFDIYRVSPDNMIITMPDSTIQFNMPNAFKMPERKISIYNLPQNFFPKKLYKIPESGFREIQ